MKRTLTVLTAAMFASAIAIPAFAQEGGAAAPAAPAAAASTEAPMAPAADASPAPKKHHRHHKKAADSGAMEGGSMASPAAAPSTGGTP